MRKNKGGNFYYFSTKAPHRHTDLAYPDNCYLLFGKETAGLPEKLLFDNPDTTVRIPMIDEARSLNLSNSVAVGVYEVLRQWGYPELSAADSSGPTAGPANNLFSFPPAVPLEAVLARRCAVFAPGKRLSAPGARRISASGRRPLKGLSSCFSQGASKPAFSLCFVNTHK